MTSFRDRIGIDVGRRLPAEQALDWAAANDVRIIDLCLDADPDLLLRGEERSASIRARLERDGVTLGLHTLSAVNMAETSPLLSEATDEYASAYIQAAKRLGASWIVVHAGYHFTGDRKARMAAGLARLGRVSLLAEKAGVTLLLENMNPEPRDAEVKYLAHDLEECHFYFDQLQSERLRWSFTVNHAHILPVGIVGFLDAMDLARCGEVRVADCHGTVEEHLPIGQGTIDFHQCISTLEERGYRGHYMQAYTTLEDMIEGREQLTRIANEGRAG